LQRKRNVDLAETRAKVRVLSSRSPAQH